MCDMATPPSPEEKGEAIELLCWYCDHTFPSDSKLRNHLNTHGYTFLWHPPWLSGGHAYKFNRTNKDGRDTFQCPWCPADYTNRISFGEHMRVGTIACPVDQRCDRLPEGLVVIQTEKVEWGCDDPGHCRLRYDGFNTHLIRMHHGAPLRVPAGLPGAGSAMVINREPNGSLLCPMDCGFRAYLPFKMRDHVMGSKCPNKDGLVTALSQSTTPCTDFPRPLAPFDPWSTVFGEECRLGQDVASFNSAAFMSGLANTARARSFDKQRLYIDSHIRPIAFDPDLMEIRKALVVDFQEQCLDNAARDVGLSRDYIRCLLYLSSGRSTGGNLYPLALLSALSPNAAKHATVMERFERRSRLFPSLDENSPSDAKVMREFLNGPKKELDREITRCVFDAMCKGFSIDRATMHATLCGLYFHSSDIRISLLRALLAFHLQRRDLISLPRSASRAFQQFVSHLLRGDLEDFPQTADATIRFIRDPDAADALCACIWQAMQVYDASLVGIAFDPLHRRKLRFVATIMRMLIGQDNASHKRSTSNTLIRDITARYEAMQGFAFTTKQRNAFRWQADRWADRTIILLDGEHDNLPGRQWDDLALDAFARNIATFGWAAIDEHTEMLKSMGPEYKRTRTAVEAKIRDDFELLCFWIGSLDLEIPASSTPKIEDQVDSGPVGEGENETSPAVTLAKVLSSRLRDDGVPDRELVDQVVRLLKLGLQDSGPQGPEEREQLLLDEYQAILSECTKPHSASELSTRSENSG